jgi:hypothetical protein
MKQFTKTLFATALVFLLAFNLQPSAFSEGVPTGGQPDASTGSGIVDQIKSFLTQPDTGLGTFTDAKKYDIWAASCFENNINADAAIGIDYAIYKHLTIDSVTRIWNSNDTIKSQTINIGVEVPIGDMKIGAYTGGVYRFDDKCPAFDVALQIKKGIGRNAYTGVRLQTDFEIQKGSTQKPFLALMSGINF